MKQGDSAPNVDLNLPDGSRSLSSFQGSPLVLYFYPKDDTPGCTTEGQAFSALAKEFDAGGVVVIGVSRESLESHAKFAAKRSITVPLAADVDGKVSEAFGVWVEKSMYGKKYMGVERATFLIDGDGRIVQVWRKVKVAGHAESVLAALKA